MLSHSMRKTSMFFCLKKTDENKLADEMHQFIRSIFDIHQSIENEKAEFNRKCVMEHIENNGVY